MRSALQRHRQPIPKRINLSWTLWLLIISPRQAFERLLSTHSLPVALSLVALGGMAAGASASVGAESAAPATLARLAGIRLDPVLLIVGGLALFLTLWLLTASLLRGAAWLLDMPAAYERLLIAVGCAHWPWTLKGILLPLSLAASEGAFAALDGLATPVTLIWSFGLQWLGVTSALRCSHKRVLAMALMVACTLLLVTQALALWQLVRLLRTPYGPALP